MKKLLAILLCLCLLLSFAACNQGGSQPTETQGETEPVDTFPYPEIKDKLTWEKINAFPIKTANMTTQEMREHCVEFMRFCKTAVWVPNFTSTYNRTSSAEDVMTQGVIHAGLPYISSATGNIYRMMDYINEETGVLDLRMAMLNPAMFGNQCSGCTYWGGWGRVINSTTEVFTGAMTQANGFLRVGPYTYPDDLTKFSVQHSTKMICEENGMDVMCQSYAQMHLADGFVNYSSAGHTLMATSEPYVEYFNGAIDPAKSYILISEQGQVWHEYTNEAGDVAQMKNSVDRKMTFMELYDNSYIPFTFAEFLGTKGIDETQCSIDLTGDSVGSSKLFKAKVTANYGISDIYVSLKNAEGKEVYRLAVRATVSGVRELAITKNGTNTFVKGNYEDLSGSYDVEVSVQLSTGERPVVYTGKVTIE